MNLTIKSVLYTFMVWDDKSMMRKTREKRNRNRVARLPRYRPNRKKAKVG